MYLRYTKDRMIDSISISESAGFPEEDLLAGFQKFEMLLSSKTDRPKVKLYDKSFAFYADDAVKTMQERKTILKQPPWLSEEMQQLVYRDYELAMYASFILDYRNSLIRNYLNTNNQQSPDSADIYTPVRADYKVLKTLDLNDPQIVLCFTYGDFVRELLLNKTMNIPRIGETPVAKWAREAKAFLSPLIGSDKGMFYDMLVGNAYALQFDLELQPLSPRQIANIQSYYKGGDMENCCCGETMKSCHRHGQKKT